MCPAAALAAALATLPEISPVVQCGCSGLGGLHCTGWGADGRPPLACGPAGEHSGAVVENAQEATGEFLTVMQASQVRQVYKLARSKA